MRIVKLTLSIPNSRRGDYFASNAPLCWFLFAPITNSLGRHPTIPIHPYLPERIEGLPNRAPEQARNGPGRLGGEFLIVDSRLRIDVIVPDLRAEQIIPDAQDRAVVVVDV